MSATVEGGKKSAKKILERDPDHFRRIGQIGGMRSSNGGFGSKKVGKDGLTGAQRALVAGSKGGTISRRKKRDEA